MNFWLYKTEPSVYSIDDLKKDKITFWDGVRNYQARNFMRDAAVGDLVLFYHSNANPPGVAGVAKIVKPAFPDPTQFNKRSKYFDPKATKDEPRWFCPELRFVKKFGVPIGLDTLRDKKALQDMVLLKRGSRLSIQPVSKKEYDTIIQLADG